MELNTGPWKYSEFDRGIPASVRLRNIGAIGASRDNHEARFGALGSQELPASDGSRLPTPAFRHVYGGAAYWGHYVFRRASLKPGATSIENIMQAYQTGHSGTYGDTVARDSGLGRYEVIDVWHGDHGYHKLWRVMIAMGKWEAGARNKRSPGYQAFNDVYNLSDQAVVNELFWGMVHGCREAWRDEGYTIETTPEELTYIHQPQGMSQNPVRRLVDRLTKRNKTT